MDHLQLKAAGQAYFVTLLWSSSWVIIKFGLSEIPPLLFAGLRYILASVILLTLVMVNSVQRKQLLNIPRKIKGKILIYGLVFYTLTQSSQFLGLSLLPAITVSFMLNFTTIFVLILAVIILHEIPSKIQIFFVSIAMGGVFFYFFPFNFGEINVLGLVVVTIGVLANASSSIIGRDLNRSMAYPPLIITALSMSFGSLIMLSLALILEGFPSLSLLSWIFIIWLAVVNTALTFTLWNQAMQHLGATEITLINSTMLPQITILAIIFLGEMPTILEWVGLVLIFFGATMVQVVDSSVKPPPAE